MNCDQQHFYVTLFSNASQSVFADNTIAAFTIHFAQPIELGSNDRWEVGLCELTCPPQYAAGTYGNDKIVGDTNILGYCNLISPQFVNSELVRCVRTFITSSLHCQKSLKSVLYACRKTIIKRHKNLVIDDGWQALLFKESKTPSNRFYTLAAFPRFDRRFR
jgi:hypothetical protein